MNKTKALKVLAEVQKYVGEAGAYGPALMDYTHEEISPGSWSICFEGGGPEDWAYHFRTEVPGVFVEPIMGCILGVYDA